MWDVTSDARGLSEDNGNHWSDQQHFTLKMCIISDNSLCLKSDEVINEAVNQFEAIHLVRASDEMNIM